MIQSSERGQILKKTIQNYNCKKIVEIGTWKGMGSTLCILESMLPDSEFVTLESNKTFFDIAVNNLKEYEGKFKMVYGSIVSYDEVSSFSSNYNLESFKQEWLKEDLDNINMCPNVIDEILDEIDFLLLDGGEFSTYPEWNKLKERTKIVALDDIREIKTSLIHHELTNDKNYELLEKTNDGNGFSIFKKIN
jgi:tRNA A58 N-methylase Trm61